jgi:hypothetical protein
LKANHPGDSPAHFPSLTLKNLNKSEKFVFPRQALTFFFFLEPAVEGGTEEEGDEGKGHASDQRNQPEPFTALRAQFSPKIRPKIEFTAQTPSVVSLYLTNINHFLVKFNKMRVVLKHLI